MDFGRSFVLAVIVMTTLKTTMAGDAAAPRSVLADHDAGAAVDTQEARELATWVKRKLAEGGDPAELGVSLKDVQELEAWVLEQEEERARRTTGNVDPQVQQASLPDNTAQPDGSSQPGTSQPPGHVTRHNPNASGPYGYNSHPNGPGGMPGGPQYGRSAVDGGTFFHLSSQDGGVVAPQPNAPPESMPAPGPLEELELSSQMDKECVGHCGPSRWEPWCAAGVVGGVELSFLHPLGEPSPSVTLTNLLTNEAYVGETLPGCATGVRTWLGFQHASGFGYRARYGHIGVDHINLTPFVPVFNGSGSGPTKAADWTAFREAYKLRADTFDLELTNRFCFHMCKLDLFFGARYAHLQRNVAATGYGTLGDVELLGLAVAANKFEGLGFTAGFEGRTPVGLFWAKHGEGEHKAHPPFDRIHRRLSCCYPGLLCGWNWYYGARVSVLWADCNTATAFTEAHAVVNTGPQMGASSARDQAFASSSYDTVAISELVLGLQWERYCCCFPGKFFFRGGLEYQYWGLGDVFASSNSFAFLHDGPDTIGGRVDAEAATDRAVDLFGFFIGAGITY